MANFIALVYATLKEEGIDTKGMSTDEAVAKFKELKGGESENPDDVKKKLNGEKVEKSKQEPKEEEISKEDNKKESPKDKLGNKPVVKDNPNIDKDLDKISQELGFEKFDKKQTLNIMRSMDKNAKKLKEKFGNKFESVWNTLKALHRDYYDRIKLGY